jgi:glutathione S-transferase
MNQIRRRVNAAVNPVSTAATRWWCHSALRHMLTGYGPTARQRHLIRHETQASRFESSAEQRAERMKRRARAIDDLLARDDRGDAGQIR